MLKKKTGIRFFIESKTATEASEVIRHYSVEVKDDETVGALIESLLLGTGYSVGSHGTTTKTKRIIGYEVYFIDED